MYLPNVTLYIERNPGVIASAKARCLTLVLLVAGALAAAAETLQTAGENEGAGLAAARISMDHHQWKSAETQLRRYLAQPLPQGTTQHEDDVPEAMYALALTLFHEDRPKESLAMYTRAAARRRPGAPDFHFIALDYVLLHDDTDADTWITRAAREDPGDDEIAYAMGRIKYTENRFSEAVTSFERALVLRPRSVKAENNLGLAFEGLNEGDKAVAAYRQAIAWEAGDPRPSEQPLLNLGNLLTDRNQLAEALPLLQRAEAIAPADGKIHAALGKLYARQMNFAQAQTELEQAVRAEPENGRLHFQLGQVYRKEGMAEKARQELARAAALQGTHSSERSDGGGGMN